MRFKVAEWSEGCDAAGLDGVARLWNNNAVGRHAFFPWTGELLARQLGDGSRLFGRLLEARTEEGELAGVTHVTQVYEDGYPPAGVVELLLVDCGFRKQGAGSALLAAAVNTLAASRIRPGFIDAMGAWPFGYAYNTLADGSERSGVFLREESLYRLFHRADFQPVKKSIVMRADLPGSTVRALPPGNGFYIAPRRENSWLDRVFRGRELWDHDMVQADGRLLSRAIFGFMENESRNEGRGVFSLFGVNTPRDQQQKGYAGVNLSHLMAHIAKLGGEALELHVYADNEPALRLYTGLGFKAVAESMMMHKRL